MGDVGDLFNPLRDAAPRISARQQILAFFDGRPGKHSTAEISEHANASQGTIYTTLSDMVARGELVRVSLGRYCLFGDPAAPAPAAIAAASTDDAEAPAAPQPPSAQPTLTAEIVERRLRTWRQRLVNRSGDQLALDDFLDRESLDDLVDFVCDEYSKEAKR